MKKEFYRNESGVVVNSSSVNDGSGTIYQLRNINSVRVVRQEIPWISTIVKSLLWMVPALLFLPLIAGMANPIFGALTFVGILGGVGYKIYKAIKQPKTIFSLILSTSSGEVDSFSSLNQEDVAEMANAVSEALDNMSHAA